MNYFLFRCFHCCLNSHFNFLSVLFWYTKARRLDALQLCGSFGVSLCCCYYSLSERKRHPGSVWWVWGWHSQGPAEMLTLANTTCIFLQLVGGNAEEENKYPVSAVKYFCLLWVSWEETLLCSQLGFSFPLAKQERTKQGLNPQVTDMSFVLQYFFHLCEGYTELWV